MKNLACKTKIPPILFVLDYSGIPRQPQLLEWTLWPHNLQECSQEHLWKLTTLPFQISHTHTHPVLHVSPGSSLPSVKFRTDPGEPRIAPVVILPRLLLLGNGKPHQMLNSQNSLQTRVYSFKEKNKCFSIFSLFPSCSLTTHKPRGSSN